tara:strand:- start:2576 stop:2767 length:192 start_codon:yes stop_codon:yes gene_type:complete
LDTSEKQACEQDEKQAEDADAVTREVFDQLLARMVGRALTTGGGDWRAPCPCLIWEERGRVWE